MAAEAWICCAMPRKRTGSPLCTTILPSTIRPALYDDIAIDNPAAALFLKHGFEEEFRTEEIIMLRKIL